MTDSSVKNGLMRVLGSIAFRHVPLHDLTLAHPHDGADPRDYAFLNATRCSRNRQPPAYLALQPFGTDVVRDLCEVYPTPFSWLATQRNHPCDMSLFESYRRCTQSTRQERDVPIPSPPNLNKRRGSNTVRSSSQVPHEFAYICRFCSFCLTRLFSPRLTHFLSLRLVAWPWKMSRCQSQCTIPVFRHPLHNLVFPLQGIPYHGSLFLPTLHVSREISSAGP